MPCQCRSVRKRLLRTTVRSVNLAVAPQRRTRGYCYTYTRAQCNPNCKSYIDSDSYQK